MRIKIDKNKRTPEVTANTPCTENWIHVNYKINEIESYLQVAHADEAYGDGIKVLGRFGTADHSIHHLVHTT